MTGPVPVKRGVVHRDAAPSRDMALRRPDAGRPSAGPRLWALPQVRHWLLLGMLLSAAVVALGLTAQLMPGFSAAEFGVDQDLSQHHAAALSTVS